MTKEQLWLAYLAKNPHFADPKADTRLSGAGLKKLFDQAYDIAHAQGVTDANAQKSIFEQVFGSRA